MNITAYRLDPRFASCRRAFLVAGTPKHDSINRKRLSNNQTGRWKVLAGRVSTGDLIFIVLAHPSDRGGYPRELYAGIVKKQTRSKDDDTVLFSVAQFYELAQITENVKEFLGGKTPPQGDIVADVWDVGSATMIQAGMTPEDDESSFPEGAVRYRLHRVRERDPEIVRKAKKKWRNTPSGLLRCCVCNFDFGQEYGERGIDYIEAHHRVPVSTLDENTKTKTKVSDLAPVCSNCHRMLHRGPKLLSIEQLRTVVLQNTGT